MPNCCAYDCPPAPRTDRPEIALPAATDRPRILLPAAVRRSTLRNRLFGDKRSNRITLAPEPDAIIPYSRAAWPKAGGAESIKIAAPKTSNAIQPSMRALPGPALVAAVVPLSYIKMLALSFDLAITIAGKQRRVVNVDGNWRKYSCRRKTRTRKAGPGQKPYSSAPSPFSLASC